MAKVQFQVDGLDSNTASIFNADATFDGNIDAASISIAGTNISSIYATQAYVSNAVSGISVDLSTSAGVGIDWNSTTSAFDIDSTVATKTYVDTAVSNVDISTKQDIVAGVSSTEIGYLDGVTSGIQTQLNSKASSSSPTLTGLVSINGYMTETMTISNSAAGSTVDYDILTNNNILYYTSNATSNWTLNIRGNSSTSLDSIMSNNQVLTVIFLVTNGSTAYYQTGFQIDGTSVTPKWLGASPITSGSASSIDIYELTIIKTASNTYTVLESSSRFA